MNKLPEENIFGENWTRLGWISLIMFLPLLVLNAFWKFDLKWMTGLPFAFFYFWSLLSFVLIPILVACQCVVIMKLWIKQKTFLFTQVILFLVVIAGYSFGFLGVWR